MKKRYPKKRVPFLRNWVIARCVAKMLGENYSQ